MRKSLENMDQNLVRKVDDYPGLPEDLKEYCYFAGESGYSIMAIPENMLKGKEENEDLWKCEVPVPVKYVLEKGYRKHGDYIIVDVDMMTLFCHEEYYEYDL